MRDGGARMGRVEDAVWDLEIVCWPGEDEGNVVGGDASPSEGCVD